MLVLDVIKVTTDNWVEFMLEYYYMAVDTKSVTLTKLPTPPEATRHNNLTKLLVLLPLRANSKRTFQCETPCTRMQKNTTYFQKNVAKKHILIGCEIA